MQIHYSVSSRKELRVAISLLMIKKLFFWRTLSVNMDVWCTPITMCNVYKYRTLSVNMDVWCTQITICNVYKYRTLPMSMYGIQTHMSIGVQKHMTRYVMYTHIDVSCTQIYDSSGVHKYWGMTWLFHMCGVTHLHVWRDSFACVTWLILMCGVTHSHVWRDSFACVAWLIRMCGVTHSYVW